MKRKSNLLAAKLGLGLALVATAAGCQRTSSTNRSEGLNASSPTAVPSKLSKETAPQQAVDSADRTTVPSAPATSTQEVSIDPVRRLVAAEELILELTPRLETFQQDLLNLEFPGPNSRSLFASNAQIFELSPASDPTTDHRTVWRGGDVKRLEQASSFPMWQSLFERLAYLEHAKLAIVRGQFEDPQLTTFHTLVSLSALGRLGGGEWMDVKGSLEVTWRRDSQAEPAWQITRWQPISLEGTSAEHRQFQEVLAYAIPDSNARRRLQESQHWLYAIHHYYPKRAARAESGIDDARFFPVSTAYHPGLSVVDLNRDGWDDLYVVDRWGKNQLLLNQGDGTFRESANDFGLAIDGRSNASVFADFDNDGDADLMIARGMDRSLYLVNEEGRFVDRSTEWISHPLPYEATSVSAVDYNGDGLLDVYFSTYHQDDISRRLDSDLSHPDHRIHRTLTPEHSAELKTRFQNETHSFINQVGPPNILLVNRGQGRFELAPENPQVAVWRNSFQATWCDYDQDGDPDLYVANDFAADHLLRNDGPDGFNDVTLSHGIDQLGFAMGASWGDYDNDGHHDLYVSNMYSKAGRRITQGVEQLDPRISQLANGNYLYRFDGQRFRLVSGLESPQLLVARAGWAWGGQFFDANNDGFLDLYVSSGYYTVPAPYETKIDL